LAGEADFTVPIEDLSAYIYRALRNKVIDSLSPEQKAVLIATEFEGRTFCELSEEWQIPIGTLLARKSRALFRIRLRLNGLV
jgi:DNA-directed RNA polymerase specialized sigma24 family protein